MTNKSSYFTVVTDYIILDDYTITNDNTYLNYDGLVNELSQLTKYENVSLKVNCPTQYTINIFRNQSGFLVIEWDNLNDTSNNHITQINYMSNFYDTVCSDGISLSSMVLIEDIDIFLWSMKLFKRLV